MVKQRYRDLCVQLHPDKSRHPRAVDAFAALTRALAAALAAARAREADGGTAAGQEGAAVEEVADDEMFWVDGSGTISVPAAAKGVSDALAGVL